MNNLTDTELQFQKLLRFICVSVSIFKPFAVTAVLAIFAGFVFASDAVIEKNKLLLEHEPGKYMEVRHIVLKGTNEEIGKALADIAKNDYNAELIKYANPFYAKARLNYMEKNYPVLLERMKGVAQSYGLSLDNTDYDTSSLFYCFEKPPACSAIFFPAWYSENGRNFYVCNRDYYLASMSEIMGGYRNRGEGDFLSRMAVIEFYPENGYSSIGIGALDLLNMHIDTINSKGLCVAVLEDDTYGMEHTIKDLSCLSGLSQYQLVRLIADTCATVEEAKEVILNNKMEMTLMPAHFMVMDNSGKSFIYERSSKDFSGHFIDNNAKPAIITNHSVYEYPSIDKFPEPSKDDYDTFNRYRKLEEFVRSQKGKFSIKDGKKGISLAYGRVNETTEGGYHNLPLRTLYTAAVDMGKRTIWVKFYLRDGKADKKTGLTELIFSKEFKFKLKK